MISEDNILLKIEGLKIKRLFWQKEMNDSYDKWKIEGGDFPHTPESQYDIYDGMIKGLEYVLEIREI